MPGGLRCSAALRAATSGPAASRTAPRAVCQFCDTDFVGTDGTLGGKFRDADALADRIAAQWPAGDSAHRFVVMTGGEPLLQVDAELIAALHARGFQIAVETNGTIAAPEGIDWICVSPKAGAPWCSARARSSRWSGPSPVLTWPSWKPPTSRIATCSPWTTPSASRTPKPASSCAWRARPGGSACRPTRSRASDEKASHARTHALRDQPDLLL